MLDTVKLHIKTKFLMYNIVFIYEPMIEYWVTEV